MDILSDELEAYLDQFTFAQHADPVLDEMEQRARSENFPIVDRAVGRLLELQARTIGARRVCEIGSGFGYSAYWFARAVGEGGEVLCSELDAGNIAAAEEFLTHAGLWDRVHFHQGDGSAMLLAAEGDFDVVFCDADKERYPEHWRNAAERIRVGGLYLADNVLWSGRVVTGEEREGLPGATAGIIEHNRLVAEDRRYVSSIVPLRDGVMVALRVG
jgi:predicted O-methyltransferase YrrM